MLEMATLGSGVLHGRSVELARKYQVPLTVAAAVGDTDGSIVAGKENTMEMEAVIVRGIPEDAAVHKVSIIGVPDQPGEAAVLGGGVES